MANFRNFKNFINNNKELIEKGPISEIASFLDMASSAGADARAGLILSIACLRDDFKELFFLVRDEPARPILLIASKTPGSIERGTILVPVIRPINFDEPIGLITKRLRIDLKKYLETNVEMPKDFIPKVLDNIKFYMPHSYLQLWGITSPGVNPAFSLVGD